ncbi:MAG: TonB-dependent siderophore receptor [Paracoccaceae bacterium]
MTGKNKAGRLSRGALAALMIATALVTTGLMPQAAAWAQESYGFAIPAQTLGTAVTEFARVTGWQVAYPAELRNTPTQAVSGSMAPAQALSRMLAGSGLSVRRTGATSAAVTSAQAADIGPVPAGAVVLDPITVSAEMANGPVNGIIATRSSTATKTDTPILETPQTVNVIGREQMEQQSVVTVTEALRYSPGIVSGTNGGQAARYDTYFVRGAGGFSADAETASTADGLRWRIPSRTGVQFDPWLVERVEVVKGPSSTLFGSGSPGGLVNLVTKRPSFQKSNTVSTTLGNDDYYQVALDSTGPISDVLAYRFLAVAHSTHSGVDFQHGKRLVLAPSLTWAPTDRTTITFQAMYHRDDGAPDANFVPAYGSVLAIPGKGKVDSSFWQGDPNYQTFDRTEASLGWQADHAINDAWSLHSGLRVGKLKTTAETMEVYGASEGMIYRYPYLAKHNTWTFATDNYVKGEFTFGQTKHTMLAGMDYQKLGGDWQDGWDYTYFGTNTLDMFAPVYGIEAGTPVLIRNFHQPFQQLGFYVQDQIEVGNWRLMAGLRHDKAKVGNRVSIISNGLVRTDDEADQSATTGRLGAVYLFDNGLAPFISYSTSFEPQLGMTPDGDVPDASKGKMLEAGLRYLSADGTLALSGTLFGGTERNYAVTTSAATCTAGFSCVTDDNKREFRGLELEAKAQLADGLDLIGAFTWQKARLTEYKGDKTDLHIVGSPDTYASLWLNYAMPESGSLRGWSFAGGARYIGSSFATVSNVWHDDDGLFDYGAYEGQSSKIPSFTLVDVSAAYDFGKGDPSLDGLSARLTIANLFDKEYIAACNGYGTCSFGDRRTVRLSLNYTW